MKPANNLIILFIFVSGLFMGFIATRWVPLRAPQITSTATLVQQIQTLSQLVTVKYVLEKVVNLEDTKWYGSDRVLLVAHGIVKSGIDLSTVKSTNIEITDNKITLTLPAAVVTDAYLDEKQTQVLDRSTGILRTFDTDKTLEQTARRQAVDDLKRAALRSGIARDAQDRAKAQLTGFFHQIGYAKVQIEFK